MPFYSVKRKSLMKESTVNESPVWKLFPFFSVSSSQLILWYLRCVLFLDKFPLSTVGYGKTKFASWLHLPSVVFFSHPTFWEVRDQPELGSFFSHSLLGGEIKDPGNRLSGSLFIHRSSQIVKDYIGQWIQRWLIIKKSERFQWPRWKKSPKIIQLILH